MDKCCRLWHDGNRKQILVQLIPPTTLWGYSEAIITVCRLAKYYPHSYLFPSVMKVSIQPNDIQSAVWSNSTEFSLALPCVHECL